MIKINLVFDIGNTHIVGGIYRQNECLTTWRWSADKTKTEDEYFYLMATQLHSLQIDRDMVSKIALSSVVPNLTSTFRHFFRKYFSCSHLILSAYSDLGLQFPMPDPGFIGSDLVVNAFSAIEKYKSNCIICDLGTATTIQLVEKNGYFHGTVIAPGILTSAAFLFEKASQLASVELLAPAFVLGKNTVDAVRSGIVQGHVFMIDGFVKAIQHDFNSLMPITTIATGGMAAMIQQTSQTISIVDKNLTIDGLNIACERLIGNK
jgi:type III pantothenate kinase